MRETKGGKEVKVMRETEEGGSEKDIIRKNMEATTNEDGGDEQGRIEG